MEGLFAEIYQISEDLSRNIASKEQKTTETNLVQIACEVLTIFAPLSLKRSVEIRTNLDTFKDKNEIILKTNELILKQLLISFIARVFFFISANSELTFLVHKISNNKSVKIEITYQGISLNEPLFQDIVFRKQNDMIAGIIRSIFTMETIESLLRDYLNGDIEIKSDSKTNHITCILPTEYDITDKVVYLSNLSWIGE